MPAPLAPRLAELGRDSTRLNVVTGARPAFGADWVFTVPGHQVWRVIGISAVLVTGHDSQDRSPQLKLKIENVTVATIATFARQIGDLTGFWSWAVDLQGVVYFDVPPPAASGFPDWLLFPGYTIGPETEELQPIDRWRAPTIMYYNLAEQRA